MMDMSARLEGKIDRILEKLEEQGKLLAKHEVLHEKNTDDLAAVIKKTDQQEASIDLRLKPIEAHVAGAAALIKAVGILIALVGVVFSAIKAVN